MKPPPFHYARPASLEQAVALLAESEGEGKILAGGQSLIPMLNFRLARPTLLIDIALVEQLRVLRRVGGELVIGAGIRHREAETSSLVLDACPLIGQALRHVGHLQIRTRGTIGGSLVHADPSAELAGVAVALDASLIAAGPRGQRVIPAGEFFHGPFSTALEEDEVLMEIRFPSVSGTRYAFKEIARRSGDFALAGVAVALRADGDPSRPTSVGFAAVGVGSAPVRLTAAEQTACEYRLDAAGRKRVAEAAIDDVMGRTDSTVGDDYRRRLVGVLIERALQEVTR